MGRVPRLLAAANEAAVPHHTSKPGVRLCLMRNVYPANESAQLLPATDRDEGPEHHLRIAKARHVTEAG